MITAARKTDTTKSAAHEQGMAIPVQRAASEQLKKVRIKQADLVLFTNQLSVMIDSGVVLSDALDAITEQTGDLAFKAVLDDVTGHVKAGETFSTALSLYPNIFNSMFISMVQASEASGKMSKMLMVLSGYIAFENETRKRIKGAMTYPLIMALMAVAATGTLMFFVLPRFTKIYEARGAALPTLTRALVGFSQLMSNMDILAGVFTAIVLIAMGYYNWSKTESGQKVLDYIKIRTPVFGTMFVDVVITRSMRIMATMINTGVSLLDSIDVIKGCCDNYYFKKLWSDADKKIRDGYQLSESIRISEYGNLISPGIVQMLRAGEKSGKLGAVSDKISIFYEQKLENSIKGVMALIEPIMITILGAIIGTIAIALLLPVFKISSVVSH
ncbi:MAG: type II secretion system F family protein [Phycisphaerae bacterium]|nr:type II secretion system F family protein [Phycisphaerae bacterium]